MNQSRKKRSRGEIRRRRQLREKSGRIASRQEEKYTEEEEVPPHLLLKKYKVELLLVAFALIGVIFVMSLGPDKEAAQKLRESFDPSLYRRSLQWNEVYSQGYKVVVFTDKNIIHTTFDTLPDDLKINWKKMSVVRIQANQLSGTTEKIKITINDITYAPANISGMSATVTLTRQKGASAKIAEFDKLNFVVKIVEDEDDQLFCLFGLRSL